MGILIWTVVGLGCGALANWMRPAKDQRGMMLTLFLGMLGGLVGGMVGTALVNGSVTVFSIESMMFAGAGALVFLLGFQLSSSILYLEH